MLSCSAPKNMKIWSSSSLICCWEDNSSEPNLHITTPAALLISIQNTSVPLLPYQLPSLESNDSQLPPPSHVGLELALQSVTHCKRKQPYPFCLSDTIFNFKLGFRDRDGGGRASIITLLRNSLGSYQGTASARRVIKMDALIQPVILCFVFPFLLPWWEFLGPWASIRLESLSVARMMDLAYL